MSHGDAKQWRAAGDVAEPTGYWGAPTSLIDWCEENYACSAVVAEFWNSMTGLFMSALGVYGLWRVRGAGAELRFQLMYAALVLVGLGTFAFHATLQFVPQVLLDEGSMLLTLCMFAYSAAPTSWRASPRRRAALATGLAGGTAAVLGAYLQLRDSLFFEGAFGAVLVFLFARTWQWVARNMGNEKARDSRRLSLVASLLFLAAFVLWFTENTWCLQLRRVREAAGPFAFLLQFHAVWHVLTGACPCSVAARAGLTRGGGAGVSTYYMGVFSVVTDPDEDPERGVVVEHKYAVQYGAFGLLPMPVPLAPPSSARVTRSRAKARAE